MTLHLEGIANEAPSDDQVTFELDTSKPKIPSRRIRVFDTLKTRNAWDAAKEQFAETLPESSAGQTALSGSGKKAKKNPLFGVDNWLVVGAVFARSTAAKTIPASILRGIGTIVDKPPGIEQFKIDAPASMRTHDGVERDRCSVIERACAVVAQDHRKGNPLRVCGDAT